MLQLPNSSDVLLGETYTCYVRLMNLSEVALSNIVIKVRSSPVPLLHTQFLQLCSMQPRMHHVISQTVLFLQCELQTSRHRLTLSDCSAKPLAQLAANEYHDFLLQHDVKEPNDHVLTCRSV